MHRKIEYCGKEMGENVIKNGVKCLISASRFGWMTYSMHLDVEHVRVNPLHKPGRRRNHSRTQRNWGIRNVKGKFFNALVILLYMNWSEWCNRIKPKSKALKVYDASIFHITSTLTNVPSKHIIRFEILKKFLCLPSLKDKLSIQNTTFYLFIHSRP